MSAMPPAHMARRMTRGFMLGSSGIHGCFAPQDGHVVASRATRLVQSRQETVSGIASVIRQLRFGLSVVADPAANDHWSSSNK